MYSSGLYDKLCFFELVDCLVIRSGSFSVMLASSGLVLFRRNEVAMLVASSFFYMMEKNGEKLYALDLGSETWVLLISGWNTLEVCFALVF